jgi:hypothetical protein
MKAKLILFLLIGAFASANAASLIVNWSMTPSDGRQLTNRTASPLSAGSALSGDGTLLELGYYSMASVSDPFAGSWTILSTSTMGDDGIEVAGRFSTSSILGGGALPGLTSSTPLAIRFYDGTSVANSTYFNAVSNTSGSWNYITPNDPSPVLNLAIDKGASIVFQNGLSGTFSTQIAIPEPSAILLCFLGAAISLLSRHRKK